MSLNIDKLQIMQNTIRNEWNAIETKKNNSDLTSAKVNSYFLSAALFSAVVASASFPGIMIATTILLSAGAGISCLLTFVLSAGVATIALAILVDIQMFDQDRHKETDKKQNELIHCLKVIEQPKFQEIIQDLKDFDPEDIGQIITITKIYNEGLSLEKRQQKLLEEQQALNAKFQKNFTLISA